MKYWLPKLALPDGKPAQSALIPKFGGLPWGFPMAQWPICGECRNPMHLVAQLPGDVPGLGIAAAEVLHLFRCCWGAQCDHAVMSQEVTGGKAALTLDRAALGQGLTRPPLTADFKARLDPPSGLSAPEQAINYNARFEIRERAILPELWITGFEQQDDGVDPDLYPQFLRRETHDQLPEDTGYPAAFDPSRDTKFGGLPYWGGNGVMEDRLNGATFLFSIGGFVYPSERVPEGYLDFDQGGGDGALVNVADGIDGESYGTFHDFCYNAPLLIFRLPDGQVLQVLAQ